MEEVSIDKIFCNNKQIKKNFFWLSLFLNDDFFFNKLILLS
jgi:hypothetical protein